ncbi:MAG: 3-isopropylmalate dehydrogenase [Bacteroidota bacterium]
MKKKIAVLPGDGVGPEVIEQAIKVLEAISERYGHQFDYQYADVGAIAIDKHNNPLPDVTLDACIHADAILFGAIGDPKYDNNPNSKIRPEQGLLRLRKALGLYANIRPVTTYKSLLHLSPLKAEIVEGVDMVIYRELTSGIYFGKKGRTEISAFDECIYYNDEIDRIAHQAFKAAGNRRKKVTLVDKANVLETSRFWRERVTDLAKSYPDIELDVMFVDNAAMQIIQYPKQFDVILTSNMFGDILSDEASVLTGSMGLLPSSSIGLRTSLFEPIHGSFPQAAGDDIANPMATILSASLMLDSFDLHKEAKVIRNTVKHILEKGIGTPELNAPITLHCSQIGDMISHLISQDDSLNIEDEKLMEKISTII